jgi:hypothetical protein
LYKSFKQLFFALRINKKYLFTAILTDYEEEQKQFRSKKITFNAKFASFPFSLRKNSFALMAPENKTKIIPCAQIRGVVAFGQNKMPPSAAAAGVFPARPNGRQIANHFLFY